VWNAATIGLNDKPIFVLDPDGFYRPLWTYLESLVDPGFVRRRRSDTCVEYRRWTRSSPLSKARDAAPRRRIGGLFCGTEGDVPRSRVLNTVPVRAARDHRGRRPVRAGGVRAAQGEQMPRDPDMPSVADHQLRPRTSCRPAARGVAGYRSPRADLLLDRPPTSCASGRRDRRLRGAGRPSMADRRDPTMRIGRGSGRCVPARGIGRCVPACSAAGRDFSEPRLTEASSGDQPAHD